MVGTVEFRLRSFNTHSLGMIGMQRRTFLATVAGTSTAAVAGCNFGGGGDDSENNRDNGTDNDENGGESSNESTDPTLGEAYQWEDSFIAEAEFDSAEAGQVRLHDTCLGDELSADHRLR